MDTTYKLGDFVALNDTDKYTCKYLYKDVNIYIITDLDEDKVKLGGIVEEVSYDDLHPIPINGDDDRWIYYDPAMAAPYELCPGQEIRPHRTDYSYYMDGLKRMHIGETDKTRYDVVAEQNFKYVHEVQHFLISTYHKHYLKINEYKH